MFCGESGLRQPTGVLIDLFLSSQSDVVHQSVFELIHTDDRALFRRQLHFALNPTQGKQAGTTDGPGKS